MYFIKEDHPVIEASLRSTSFVSAKPLNAGSAPLGAVKYVPST